MPELAVGFLLAYMHVFKHGRAKEKRMQTIKYILKKYCNEDNREKWNTLLYLHKSLCGCMQRLLGSNGSGGSLFSFWLID
mgnify:CR=1 FL=1